MASATLELYHYKLGTRTGEYLLINIPKNKAKPIERLVSLSKSWLSSSRYFLDGQTTKRRGNHYLEQMSPFPRFLQLLGSQAARFQALWDPAFRATEDTGVILLSSHLTSHETVRKLLSTSYLAHQPKKVNPFPSHLQRLLWKADGINWREDFCHLK